MLSSNDEFADYETWDQGNLDLSVAKQPEMLQYEYARSALELGLQHSAFVRASSHLVESMRAVEDHGPT